MKRIAVLDFEDAAATQPQSFDEDNPMAFLAAMSGKFGGQQAKPNIGQMVSSMLVTELVKDGTYKVVERNQMQGVLKEQKLANSGTVSSADAAKIGKVLGVSAIVTGSVYEYQVSSRKKGILGIGSKKTTGKVSLNARMIDTMTGDILFAADGSGEESASGLSLGGIYSSDVSNYGNTLLGKATRKALENIFPEIIAYASKLKEPPVSGLVAYYDNNAKCCYLDLGEESGIKKDQTLYVIRVVREIKSPTTGEVIKTIKENVAELKVTQVEKTSTTASCISGNCEDIKEMDQVSSTNN
jgi:curli biogenesis system outer membrane secretion channel CsgG